MGKKAAEEIGKALLISIISFLLTTTYVRQKVLNDKLDKIEYRYDQDSRWNTHKSVHEIESKALEDLSKQVGWLYQNEINKRTNSIPPLKLDN